jgi:hypothetical protein
VGSQVEGDLRDPRHRRGAIELISPREHSLLWEIGPEGARKVARFSAENPNYMRLIGVAQIAFGLWFALRQYREE